MYITHPHLWDIMKNWIKKNGELKDNVIKFVIQKFNVPIEMKVVLAHFKMQTIGALLKWVMIVFITMTC